jgi:carbon-monoxide dehydrogenase large subunit
MTDMSNSPIGKPLQRREDYRFLTGAGQYTDDVVLPGQTYGYFLRSPHAHARIKSIDTSKAAKAARAWCRSSPAPTSPKPRSAACPAAG